MLCMKKYQLLVTCAIIENDKGEFLITQRPLDKHNGGRWEFNGGTIEHGEDPRVCLKRELYEELGIIIDVLEPFEYSSHIYDEVKHVVLLGFYFKYISGEIQKKDIADFAWVKPEKMKSYDITEADHPMVNKLLKK